MGSGGLDGKNLGHGCGQGVLSESLFDLQNRLLSRRRIRGLSIDIAALQAMRPCVPALQQSRAKYPGFSSQPRLDLSRLVFETRLGLARPVLNRAFQLLACEHAAALDSLLSERKGSPAKGAGAEPCFIWCTPWEMNTAPKKALSFPLKCDTRWSFPKSGLSSSSRSFFILRSSGRSSDQSSSS